ncbi:hypothetical protein CONCODRAFT_11517 [Conidiobolus coronatus NRRL 28638]|uniref:Xylanolytic transcriptional activator regulatory domain-containing protein n=1 Tax=Conidiobolus coronatus (strain ATCC 28846 / CBS 209.66 / NRRL 28638) TaxID=796925 RepID=A0A137NUV8_CONC2|nr:hypothetical protein CONCODRAFT_11517 [Conidiobolus coronatus NRRL 28638]|eukprot:KXN66593.1 hypothetical protein CONCODRAFT_11517 [Conidiobolus coronatus NRRL 28638]
MNSFNFNSSYKICDKCKKGLSIVGDYVCRGCKPKREYNRTLDKSLSKKYLHKFETKNISSNRSDMLENKFPVMVLYSSKFKILKEMPLPASTKAPLLYFKLYWDQFRDFESFSSFIVNSSQIGTNYFIFSSFEIQQKSNIQFFIQSKIDKLSIILPSADLLLSVPLSRPLQLLTQKSYLDSLIESYFKNVHISIPLFSIHSFNPKTASKHLLAIIYYGGFLFMGHKPSELVGYFNEYVKENIMKAIRSISIQNTISVLLYSFLQLISGNFTLSKSYMAHAIRMGYTLGLHINIPIQDTIQRYNRTKIFYTLNILHVGSCGTEGLCSNMLAEFGEFSIDHTSPLYQIPNSSCSFHYDTKEENILYGLCVDMHSRYSYIQSFAVWNVSICSEDSVEKEFDKYLQKITKCYLKAIVTFNKLSLELPHLKYKIQKHSLQLHLDFSIAKLDLYRILKSKTPKLKPGQITNLLSECCSLLDLVLESKEFKQVYNVYPYTVGLNFIRLYSISNSNQRKIIKTKLTQLLVFLSSRTCSDKLCYLIIKNEYEKITKS